MQYAVFPLRHTWISQGMNGKVSHLGTKAIDFGWLKAYNDFTLYAPFDGHVVWHDSLAKGGALAFQSDEPVIYADGTAEYMTLITAHDNNPPAVGSAFKQGQIYSHMGTAGGVGKHCHLEVQKGKFRMWSKKTVQGYYAWDNTVAPYTALFLTGDTYINQASSVVWYAWKRLTEVTPCVDRDEAEDQLLVKAEALRVRTSPSTTGTFLGYAEYHGIYDVLSVTANEDYTWYRIAEGQWVADISGKWVDFMPSTLREDYEKLKVLYNELLEDRDRINGLYEKNREKKNEYKRLIDKVKVILDKTLSDSGKIKQIRRTLE